VASVAKKKQCKSVLIRVKKTALISRNLRLKTSCLFCQKNLVIL
jgi:hypothetical protein